MRYLFLDCETTGDNPSIHAMVELALRYHIHGGETHKLRSWLMRPWEGAEVSDSALQILGTTRDDLLRRPDPMIAWRHVTDYIKELHQPGSKLTLVGYNVQFDERFLVQFLSYPKGPERDLSFPFWSIFQWPSRCIAQMVANALGDGWLYYTNHKLQTVADRVGVSAPPGEPHSAPYDCELGFRIWKEMQRR